MFQWAKNHGNRNPQEERNYEQHSLSLQCTAVAYFGDTLDQMEGDYILRGMTKRRCVTVSYHMV
jgi:hypothetical protein